MKFDSRGYILREAEQGHHVWIMQNKAAKDRGTTFF